VRTVILTYDPGDRACGAVGFVAAWLERAGLHVWLDPRELVDSAKLDKPEKLWWQLKPLLTNKARSDGWAAYASWRVLSSPTALAALRHVAVGAKAARGESLGRLALVPGSEPLMVQPDVGFGAMVRLSEPDWPERARAALDGVRLDPRVPIARPYVMGLHHRRQERPLAEPADQLAIETRPLAGTWECFFAGAPLAEREEIIGLTWGGRGFPLWDAAPPSDGGPDGSDGPTGKVEIDEHGAEWWIATDPRAATRSDGYYVHCRRIPSVLRFGVPGGHLQYTVRLAPVERRWQPIECGRDFTP